MMWDFSGGASNGQGHPYPIQQQQPAPSFPAAPGYGYPASAPPPSPFMPIGSAVPSTAASFAGSFYSVTPWAVPRGPGPAPQEPASIPRGPEYRSSRYTVHTHHAHHSSHQHHSHSHSHSPGHGHSHSHSQPAGPTIIVHHGSNPAPVVVQQTSTSKPQQSSSSKPHRDSNTIQESAKSAKEHFFHSKCTGKKKALCIGINYIGLPNELHGCINDARNVERFLLRNGYKAEDIVVLTDDATDSRQRPTKANILDAMHWLVTGAHAHDALFFHYSGHGGQVKDKDGDEVDGFDEIIFPLDYNKAGYITDDLMHTIMVKKLPAGCRLTALFDSCHSGSVLDLPYLYSSDGHLKGSQVTKRWIDYKSTPADVITWSGCKDSQTSADTWEAGVAVGAMSYAFISSLKKNPNQTYQELLRSVRTILKKHYSQKPQLSSSHRIDTTRNFIF